MSETKAQKKLRLLEEIKALRHTREVEIMLELLDVMYEEVREDLVTATPEEFQRVQGFAAALRRVKYAVTRPNPATPKE